MDENDQQAASQQEEGRDEPASPPTALDLGALQAFAHRLRSCLTAIGAAADYMLEANLEPDKQREMLYLIDDEARRIGELLSDLLVVAMNGEMEGAGALSSVDLGSVTKRVVHRLAPHAQAAGAWLVADASEPCPPVLGDEQLLQQAVMGAVRSVLGLARTGDRVLASLRPARAPADRRARVELIIGLESPVAEGSDRADGVAFDDLPLTAARLIADRYGGTLDTLTDRPGVFFSLPAAPIHTRPAAQALRNRNSDGGTGLPTRPLPETEGWMADACG